MTDDESNEKIENCGNCRFYETGGREERHCRRRAPVPWDFLKYHVSARTGSTIAERLSSSEKYVDEFMYRRPVLRSCSRCACGPNLKKGPIHPWCRRLFNDIDCLLAGNLPSRNIGDGCCLSIRKNHDHGSVDFPDNDVMRFLRPTRYTHKTIFIGDVRDLSITTAQCGKTTEHIV
jgi:hypothetical protein